MNWIAELLPLFFVRWYAHKYVEREPIRDATVMRVRPGVFISLKDAGDE